MNVTSVVLARAIRGIEQKRAIYLPDLVGAVQQRYGFVKFPATPREILAQNDTTPLLFEHGKYSHAGRSILVPRLELYGHAITADGADDTSDADLVIDDLLSVGKDFVNPTAQRFYMSQLEVSYSGSIPIPARMVPAYAAIASALARFLPAYQPDVWPADVSPANFRVAAVGMMIDPAVAQLPCDFRWERRANAPFSSNLFFSQAPLRTQDHVSLLQAYKDAAAGEPPEA